MDRQYLEIILLELVILFEAISKETFVYCTSARVGLPVIQIHNGGDDYPEMQEEVHLEDFFWTGSGDGPPDYLKRVHTGISKGNEVIVKTEMVVATVYVDGNNEIDIPICLDCYPAYNGYGVLGVGDGSWHVDKEDVGKNYYWIDRRYWLLTVMSGFYSLQDNPLLEEKLARLYRLAFTRQHTKHLGFASGAQQNYDTDSQHRDGNGVGKEKRVQESEVEASEIEVLNAHSKSLSDLMKPTWSINKNSEFATSSEETVASPMGSSSSDADHSTTSLETDLSAIDTSAYVTIKPWEFIQEANEFDKMKLPSSHHQLKLPNFTGDRIRVIIHNITQISEEDLSNADTLSGYEEDVNDKLNQRPIANQTELIYSVFVNGLPVLATTAAADMKLVTELEVTEVIGKDVFLKAEPYIREPQATPLAPATRSGAVAFLDSIQNNPVLVIISSIAILLLLLLLIALFVIGRGNRKKTTTEEITNLNHSNLSIENQSTVVSHTASSVHHHHHLHHGHDHTDRSTVQSRDEGENSCDKLKQGVAYIHFPDPPHLTTNSRRDSATSFDNTSDSSIYCPLNSPAADLENVQESQAIKPFENHNRHGRYDHHPHQRNHGYRRGDTVDHDDPLYTSIPAEKKRDRAHNKTKRRYISENRVGSFDANPSQQPRQQHRSSAVEEYSTDSNADGDGMRPKYQNIKHAEAFNQHNNYQRNLVLHQQRLAYGDIHKNYDTADSEFHTRTSINRQLTQAFQSPEKTSDTGSIGSFLSMASLKAFPKSSLPEPLNRVLEPVFVTYYDNVEDSNPSARKPTNKTNRRPLVNNSNGVRVATVEKPPSKTKIKPSHSDNADPGVIGPLVWERHRRGLDKVDDSEGIANRPDCSPIRDPAAIRNHYEDILESAIQMYTSEDDLPKPLPTCNFTNSQSSIHPEHRGSSAGVPSNTTRSCHYDIRPATAQPNKMPKSSHSTQPPSPTSGAWGSSIHDSHSPLVRPMSAGSFH